MREALDDTWVSCGKCSAVVRNHAELIRHVEATHMQDRDSTEYETISRDDLHMTQRHMRATAMGAGWTEHMFVDRTVLRCKGAVGPPYVQQIDHKEVKVQKMCPATSVVSEAGPRNLYRLRLFWQHVGHDSFPFETCDETARAAMMDRLRDIVERAVHCSEDMRMELVEKVVKKAQELDDLIHRLRPGEMSQPLTRDRRKRKHEPVKQKDVDKAVEKALEKYIKAKNPVIKLEPIVEQPKIVNTFSLQHNIEDIDDFVKDVELLVNNGKTLDAVENRSKLGQAGKKRARGDDIKYLNIHKKGQKDDEDLKEDVKIQKSETEDGQSQKDEEEDSKSQKDDLKSPFVKMKKCQKSTFNDTYKDFINHLNGSDTNKSSNKKIKGPYSKKGDNPVELITKPVKVKIEENVLNRAIPEAERMSTPIKGGIPDRTQLDQSYNSILAKRLLSDPTNSASDFEKSLQLTQINSQVKTTPQIRTALPVRTTPEGKTERAKTKRSRVSFSTLEETRRKSCPASEVTPQPDSNKVQSQVVTPTSPKSIMKKSKDTLRLKGKKYDAKPSWKVRSLKKLPAQAKREFNDVLLELQNNSKHLVIKELKQKRAKPRAKTGLKSKPINKPKSKSKITLKPAKALKRDSTTKETMKICTEKEEFIVKEQQNDVNILIIRM